MILKLAQAIAKYAVLDLGATEVAAAASVLATLDDALPLMIARLEATGYKGLANKSLRYLKFVFPLMPLKVKFYSVLMRSFNPRERKIIIAAVRKEFPSQFRHSLREEARKFHEESERVRTRRERARKIDPYNPLLMGQNNAKK